MAIGGRSGPTRSCTVCVQEKAFRKIHRDAFDEEMVIIDARWVRRWKKLSDGTKKSRPFARGCLDRQKDLLTTRSTTATHLSQRMLLSTAAVFDLEVERLGHCWCIFEGFGFSSDTENAAENRKHHSSANCGHSTTFECLATSCSSIQGFHGEGFYSI